MQDLDKVGTNIFLQKNDEAISGTLAVMDPGVLHSSISAILLFYVVVVVSGTSSLILSQFPFIFGKDLSEN